MSEIGHYEGSHIFILDSVEQPTRVVLATNPYIRHVTTPGFGPRGEQSFEDAAKRYVKKQTGLEIDELELIDEWDNGGEPFTEPNGVVQYVVVRNYLAKNLGVDYIERTISEYGETYNGQKYRPCFVGIAELPNIENLAPDVIGLLRKCFKLDL